jgi:hypothetical protein
MEFWLGYWPGGPQNWSDGELRKRKIIGYKISIVSKNGELGIEYTCMKHGLCGKLFL